MEKRTVLAIVLSISVLLIWSALTSKKQPIESQRVTKETPALQGPAAPAKVPATPAVPRLAPELSPESLIKFSLENFEVTFVEPQASIKEILFKFHQDYKFPLQYGLLLDDKTLNFKKEHSTADTITFVHSDQNKKIIKRFTFSKANYSVSLDINVQNVSGSPLAFQVPIILGTLDFSPKNVQSRFQDVAVATTEKVQHLNARKNLSFENLKFIALRDRYFCAILGAEGEKKTGFIRKVSSTGSEVGLSLGEVTIPAGQQLVQKFSIYLGPQDLRLINSVNPHWAVVINYGTFDFISQILLQLLEFFYRLVHNWGWAIVILSLAVYLLLYPLTLKQMRSMKEMQVLQPKVEALRVMYKDNPQKLNKEIMELYREHKVNPLGGCLPLLLQMPIFFALYQALMRSVVLKGAKFLWIKDLSEPDRLFTLPMSLPVLGNEINILPILMTIGMFVQQKMSMAASSGSSADQQKIMLIVFPLMFGLIFYHMPAGLVLYWFINSTLMLIYQIRVTRAK